MNDVDRARSLLRERLPVAQLSARMAGLMSSLQSALEGRRADTLAVVAGFTFERDPELLVYLARHCAMVGATSEAIGLLQRARAGGFTSTFTLDHDETIAPLRRLKDFQREAGEWARTEESARRELGRHRLPELFDRA